MATVPGTVPGSTGVVEIFNIGLGEIAPKWELVALGWTETTSYRNDASVSGADSSLFLCFFSY